FTDSAEAWRWLARDEFADLRRKSVRASATFSGLPLLRVSRNVVRVVIAEATLCQRVGVALFERAILAAPCTRLVRRVYRAPRSLGSIDVSWTKACQCKSSGAHQNCAYHHFNPHRGLVINTKEVVAISIIVSD